jgi:hypothetical protein
MRVIKAGGLCVCLAAVLAGAIATSSASALPMFFECHKGPVGSGEYADKNCTTLAEPGKGKYTLQEGVGKGKPFTAKGGGVSLQFQGIAGEFTCKTVRIDGTVTTPTTEGEVVIQFSSCTELGKKCTTSGHIAGTIVSNSLKGTLGYIKKSPLHVGVSYTAEAEAGGVWAEYNCEGLEVVDLGSLIGERTGNINSFSKSFTDIFNSNGSGGELVKSFEGGPTEAFEAIVNGNGPHEASVEGSATGNGENLEIVA